MKKVTIILVSVLIVTCAYYLLMRAQRPEQVTESSVPEETGTLTNEERYYVTYHLANIRDGNFRQMNCLEKQEKNAQEYAKEHGLPEECLSWLSSAVNEGAENRYNQIINCFIKKDDYWARYEGDEIEALALELAERFGFDKALLEQEVTAFWERMFEEVLSEIAGGKLKARGSAMKIAEKRGYPTERVTEAEANGRKARFAKVLDSVRDGGKEWFVHKRIAELMVSQHGKEYNLSASEVDAAAKEGEQRSRDRQFGECIECIRDLKKGWLACLDSARWMVKDFGYPADELNTALKAATEKMEDEDISEIARLAVKEPLPEWFMPVVRQDMWSFLLGFTPVQG